MEKLILVLLAAGDSRRFRGNKLLYEWQGKPMYRHIVDQIASLPADCFMEKIVVTQYETVKADLESRGYRAVENHESTRGISHSIQLALQSFPDAQAAVCFAVCDQPYLKTETLSQLICGWQNSKKGMGCLSYQGEPGNPAIFSKQYWEELMNLEGDVGGKCIIRAHPEDLYSYEIEDAKELEDVDVRGSSENKS
ncbi:MAG: nucleotidyltransferase family protein [Hungatella sp.]